MFSGATSFNGVIANWDTSKVTNFSNMFILAGTFNQDIGNWNIANVTDYRDMFNGATAFNQKLIKWEIAKSNLPHSGIPGMFGNLHPPCCKPQHEYWCGVRTT
tara:strand:+ start:23660 stop:23968 length:309 start_codon:yes stop_codon:yes gene_type:complete